MDINAFKPDLIVGYSLVLNYVVDVIGKIPGINKVVQGVIKQVVAGVIGVGFCITQKVDVLSSPATTGGEVVSGIILASVAGVGWSKLEGIFKGLKDKAQTDSVVVVPEYSDAVNTYPTYLK